MPLYSSLCLLPLAAAHCLLPAACCIALRCEEALRRYGGLLDDAATWILTSSEKEDDGPSSPTSPTHASPASPAHASSPLGGEYASSRALHVAAAAPSRPPPISSAGLLLGGDLAWLFQVCVIAV